MEYGDPSVIDIVDNGLAHMSSVLGLDSSNDFDSQDLDMDIGESIDLSE